MPSKASVKTSFQRAATTPSDRVPKPREISDPKPKKKRKDLAAYVRENEDTGIPIPELIEQYQMYDCDHPPKQREIIATDAKRFTTRCNKCGLVSYKLRPGVKKDD